MTRRVALLALASAAARAGAAEEVFELAASMAAALAEPNLAAFMSPIDPAMPGRDELELSVQSLIAQADVISSVSSIRQEGTADRQTLVLDWWLRLKRRGDDLQTEERRQPVTIETRKQGRRWIVTAIRPPAFFAAPAFK